MIQVAAVPAAGQPLLPFRLRRPFLSRKLGNPLRKNLRQGLLIRQVRDQTPDAGASRSPFLIRVQSVPSLYPIRSSATEQAGIRTFSRPFSTVKSVKGTMASSALSKSLY